MHGFRLLDKDFQELVLNFNLLCSVEDPQIRLPNNITPVIKAVLDVLGFLREARLVGAEDISKKGLERKSPGMYTGYGVYQFGNSSLYPQASYSPTNREGMRDSQMTSSQIGGSLFAYPKTRIVLTVRNLEVGIEDNLIAVETS